MSPAVFFTVLFAALLHAVWNALVKSGADKHAAMAMVVLGHVPVSLLVLGFVPLPDPAALPWLLSGIGLHVGYQLFLVAAYRLGDLTQVYPIARGVAPVIVVVVSISVLGVRLVPIEVMAVLLIASGLLSLALVRRADGVHNPQAVAMALVTGCFIAGYSLVDGIGARAAGTAVGYWTCSALGNALVFTPLTAVIRPGLLRRSIANRRILLTGLLGGTASYLAYALVVWAFVHAPIALVAALREVSIVFALLIGTLLLGERLDRLKMVATGLALAGAVLLRLADRL